MRNSHQSRKCGNLRNHATVPSRSLFHHTCLITRTSSNSAKQLKKNTKHPAHQSQRQQRHQRNNGANSVSGTNGASSRMNKQQHIQRWQWQQRQQQQLLHQEHRLQRQERRKQGQQPQPQHRHVLRCPCCCCSKRRTGSSSSRDTASVGKRSENLGWPWEPSNVLLRTVPHQLVPATSTVRTSMTSPRPLSEPLSPLDQQGCDG